MFIRLPTYTLTGLLALMLATALASGQQPGAMEIRPRVNQPVPGQQVIVGVASGVPVAATQPADTNLRTGRRGYIEGGGEGARVVPQ